MTGKIAPVEEELNERGAGPNEGLADGATGGDKCLMALTVRGFSSKAPMKPDDEGDVESAPNMGEDSDRATWSSSVASRRTENPSVLSLRSC